MAKQNDEFLKKLLETFRVEADEHLKAISGGLIELEKNPDGEARARLVESVFRETHSLKGAARAVSLSEIEALCQSLESVFAGLKNNQFSTSPQLFDLLHESLDTLAALLAPTAGAEPREAPIAALRQRLDGAPGGIPAKREASAPSATTPPSAAAAAAPAAPEPAPVAAETVRMPPPVASLSTDTIRVATARIDAVMRQVEELLSPKLAAAQRAAELRATAATLAGRKKERARLQSSLRIIERSFERDGSAGKMRPELTRLLEYLDAEQLFVKTLEGRLARLCRAAEHDRRVLGGMADALLRDMKEMHMLPFSTLLDVFPRFSRDLAHDQGKEVALEVAGGEIEIDRRILEEMKDPLIHMLRNCIDHGIEKPDARQKKGKPPQGTVNLAISQHDSSTVEILVADDGAGIDTAKVKAAAVRIRLLTDEEAEKMGEGETLGLVFRSGISTSPIITDVSGRGLGLAIALEKVERLGGAIALESQPGAGTRLRITLPLTLATFQGVLVRAGAQLFVIPSLGVKRVDRGRAGDVRTVENRETIALGGETISVVRLGDVLELPRPAEDTATDSVPVVVLGLGREQIAFQVEEIVGAQEVLVKPLGRQLARVRNMAGATVLGNGQVVLVLNVSDLLQSAVKRPPAPQKPAAAIPEETAKRSILVVEDSITSRSLLKNILESAGYRVATAVDGVDAYTLLKTSEFDLIVSDVDMPRMNGFDLTAKVRADRRLAELPVVLVTALESREHRERGIDVGANAYIVKSSFDQSNLLEVVKRLA